MLKNLPLREKVAKIILIILVVFACIAIFPKNFKIAVLNYDGRQSSVVLGDEKKGETREVSYIFGKGNFWVSPIAKGTVKSLYIGDDKEFVDEVTAYYGSVKISKDVQISGNDGALIANLTYSTGKIVLMVVLYALLSLSIMIYGILKILASHISFPEKLNIYVYKRDVLIFAGISVTYMVVSYLVSVNQLIRWIYPLEIIFSGFMLFTTLCVEKQLSKHRLGAVISSIPIGTCLAISINKICAFTFVDGHQAIMEQVNYDTDKLRHWEKSSARLNYIIMGTFERFNFIEKLKGETPAKIMHWFFGVVLFVYVVWFITKKLLRNDSDTLKSFQFTAVFCSIFLYNYTLTALKNYNYDLFSISFGAVAFIHMIYAARTHSKNYAISAVVFATLGTLEKIIVWPIMLLCMLAYVIIATLNEKRPIIKGLINSIKVEGIAILVSMCCNLWIQHVVRSDYFPNYNVMNLLKPLQGEAYVVLSFALQSLNLKGSFIYVLGNILNVIAVFVVYLIIIAVTEKVYSSFNFLLTLLNILTLLIVFITLAYSCIDSMYLHTLNDLFVALSSSLVTIGSVHLFLFVSVLILGLRISEHKELIVFMALFGVYMPMIYVLLQKIYNGRYFNLYNLLAIIALTIFVLDVVSVKIFNNIAIIVSLGFVFALVELSAFSPDHFFFVPIWNNSYIGDYFAGGSERMKLGESVLKYIEEKQLSSKDVKLYYNYGGDWNACPAGWECKTFLSDGLDSLGQYTFNDVEFGDNIYYIFTTASVEKNRYSFYPMPDENYEPILAPKVRGKLIGNVYRSEELRPYFEEVFKTYK